MVFYPLVCCLDVDVETAGNDSNLLADFPSSGFLPLLDGFASDACHFFVLACEDPLRGKRSGRIFSR